MLTLILNTLAIFCGSLLISKQNKNDSHAKSTNQLNPKTWYRITGFILFLAGFIGVTNYIEKHGLLVLAIILMLFSYINKRLNLVKYINRKPLLFFIIVLSILLALKLNQSNNKTIITSHDQRKVEVGFDYFDSALEKARINEHTFIELQSNKENYINDFDESLNFLSHTKLPLSTIALKSLNKINSCSNLIFTESINEDSISFYYDTLLFKGLRNISAEIKTPNNKNVTEGINQIIQFDTYRSYIRNGLHSRPIIQKPQISETQIKDAELINMINSHYENAYNNYPNNIDQTILSYKKALEIDSNAVTYFNLGCAYILENSKNISNYNSELLDAEYYFTKAIKLDSSLSEAYYNRAICFLNNKRGFFYYDALLDLNKACNLGLKCSCNLTNDL